MSVHVCDDYYGLRYSPLEIPRDGRIPLYNSKSRLGEPNMMELNGADGTLSILSSFKELTEGLADTRLIRVIENSNPKSADTSSILLRNIKMRVLRFKKRKVETGT